MPTRIEADLNDGGWFKTTDLAQSSGSSLVSQDGKVVRLGTTQGPATPSILCTSKVPTLVVLLLPTYWMIMRKALGLQYSQRGLGVMVPAR